MPIGSRIKERRLELKRLHGDRYRVANVAARVGLKPTTLYDLERGEQQTTKVLRALCKDLGLNQDWAETGRGPRLAKDSVQGEQLVRTDQVTLHGMQITTEEVEFGIEWGKLEEPQKSLIREQVLLLVASQVRRRRTKEPQELAAQLPKKPN